MSLVILFVYSTWFFTGSGPIYSYTRSSIIYYPNPPLVRTHDPSHWNLHRVTNQEKLHNLWGPVQKENVGPLIQILARILKWWKWRIKPSVGHCWVWGIWVCTYCLPMKLAFPEMPINCNHGLSRRELPPPQLCPLPRVWNIQ